MLEVFASPLFRQFFITALMIHSSLPVQHGLYNFGQIIDCKKKYSRGITQVPRQIYSNLCLSWFYSRPAAAAPACASFSDSVHTSTSSAVHISCTRYCVDYLLVYCKKSSNCELVHAYGPKVRAHLMSTPFFGDTQRTTLKFWTHTGSMKPSANPLPTVFGFVFFTPDICSLVFLDVWGLIKRSKFSGAKTKSIRQRLGRGS